MRIFYSWQSDLPPNLNRNFILSALERACKNLAQDDSIQSAPRVDRDTQGVPGAPDIVATILRKIDEADMFVADVSFVGQGLIEPDKMANPNVLVELGYALKALGDVLLRTLGCNGFQVASNITQIVVKKFAVSLGTRSHSHDAVRNTAVEVQDANPSPGNHTVMNLPSAIAHRALLARVQQR